MPGLMLRLPSAAVRRSWHSQASAGDLPISPPDSPVSPPHRNLSVRREKFFLMHESSARLHDVYEVEMRPLGEGSFGVVYRARMRGAAGVVRAVKAVRKRSTAAESMARAEIAILRRLDHPHICRLLETFEEEKTVYLVMEYVDGQELFDYISNSVLKNQELGEDFAARVMCQVWGALHYCHERAVVHRDLKPENIMVLRRAGGASEDQAEIKLIDFGLATLRKGGRSPTSGSLAGTFAYMAPEARQGTSHPPSDCWSSGMVLHALLLGGLPSESIRTGDESLDVSSGDYSDVSQAAKELLAGLLHIDPLRRLTAAVVTTSAWAQGSVARATLQKFDKSTVNALVAFHRSTMLQQAVLTALSIQMSGEHMSDLREQFLKLDKDQNGHISREELRSIAAGSSWSSADMDWVDGVFDSVDTDGSSNIEYTEWLAAALQGDRERAERTVLAAFRVFDVDGSGKVDQKEIARVITQSPTDIAKLIPEFDVDGDGELSLEEFRSMILGMQATVPQALVRELAAPAATAAARAPRRVCEAPGPPQAVAQVGSVRPCGRVLHV